MVRNHHTQGGEPAEHELRRFRPLQVHTHMLFGKPFSGAGLELGTELLVRMDPAL
jgi:hypothetical protein